MLKRGKGIAEITKYLGDVRTKAFRRDPNEEADQSFAERVVAWYSLEVPVRDPATPR